MKSSSVQDIFDKYENRVSLRCIPEVSGEFVARLEDVLDLYEEE